MDNLLKLMDAKDVLALESLKEEYKNQIMLSHLNWVERADLYKKIQFINNCISRIKGENKMADDVKSLLQEILKNQRETNTRLDTIDLRLTSVENRAIVAESDISTIKENFATRPLLDGQS